MISSVCINFQYVVISAFCGWTGFIDLTISRIIYEVFEWILMREPCSVVLSGHCLNSDHQPPSLRSNALSLLPIRAKS